MDLIEDIYEAAWLGNKWPDLLDKFGKHYGSKGALIFADTEDGLVWTGSGEAKTIMQESIDLGWAARNDRPAMAAARNLTHFITDTDLFKPEELATVPIYRDFLIPRGGIAFCGTLIYGLEGDLCVFSVEGLPSDAAARAAIPELNLLHPHISRAVMLSSRLRLERARAMTDALKAIGVPAAIINTKGAIRSANTLFEPLIGRNIHDRLAGISLTDATTNKLLQNTLAQIRQSHGYARSIPLAGSEGEPARILHLIPITGEARDLFSSNGILMAIAGGNNSSARLPASLLQTLFDMTPAEARITRELTLGHNLSHIARSSGVSIHTVRTQTKSILSKTGLKSQKDLVVLLKDLSFGNLSPQGK